MKIIFFLRDFGVMASGWKRSSFSREYTWISREQVVLLMVEILQGIQNPVNNGINYQPQLVSGNSEPIHTTLRPPSNHLKWLQFHQPLWALTIDLKEVGMILFFVEALHYAAYHGHLPVVMELLKGNPNKEHREFWRRLVASLLGSKRLVKGCGIFPEVVESSRRWLNLPGGGWIFLEVVVVPTFGGVEIGLPFFDPWCPMKDFIKFLTWKPLNQPSTASSTHVPCGFYWDFTTDNWSQFQTLNVPWPVVVSNMFYVHSYLGKNLPFWLIFSDEWFNHQPALFSVRKPVFLLGSLPSQNGAPTKL